MAWAGASHGKTVGLGVIFKSDLDHDINPWDFGGSKFIFLGQFHYPENERNISDRKNSGIALKYINNQIMRGN